MEVTRRDALAAVDVCLRGDHEGAMMVLGSADGLLRVAAFLTAATITDRSALAAALRNLKLSGMLETLDARLAQAIWTSCRSCARTRSPAAEPWP